VATVKKMYAYYDEEKAEDGAVPKSACKLPHHFVSSDGSPGAASVNGVRNALARLPQTQGLSDAERSAAEAHLRAHLNAFNGDSDDEDHTHEDVDDHTHVHEDIEDAATKKKTPPPDESPDEDEENEPDEEEPDEDDTDNTAATPVDGWSQILTSLVSPSPSADDVFKSLKEAW
jgi:hypothetical protein